MTVSERPLSSQGLIQTRSQGGRVLSLDLDLVVSILGLRLGQVQVAGVQISLSNYSVHHSAGVVVDGPETKTFVEMIWRRELASASWTLRKA